MAYVTVIRVKQSVVNHLFQDAPVMDHATLLVIVFVILVGLVQNVILVLRIIMVQHV